MPEGSRGEAERHAGEEYCANSEHRGTCVQLYAETLNSVSKWQDGWPTNSVGFISMVPVAAQLGIVVLNNGSGAPVKKHSDWVYRVNPVSTVSVRPGTAPLYGM